MKLAYFAFAFETMEEGYQSMTERKIERSRASAFRGAEQDLRETIG
jgi:hypothetical protein